MIRPLRAHSPVWPVPSLLALALLGGGAGAAAEPARELPPVVYLPAPSPGNAGFDPAGKGVWLPYERFAAWWAEAHPQPVPPVAPPLGAAITGLTLTGTVDGGRVHFAAALTVVAVAPGWSQVTLPGSLPLLRLTAADPRVVIQRQSPLIQPVAKPAENAPGTILPVADQVLIHLPGPGTYPLTGDIVAPLVGDPGTRQEFALDLPTAGATRVDLLIPGPTPAVSISSGGAWSQKTDADGTRVVLAPNQGQIAVAWQPAVATTGTAVITSTLALTAELAPRAIRYDLAADLVIARRPVDRLDLDIPAGFQVLAVDGPDQPRWESREHGVAILLARPTEGALSLRIRLERTGEQSLTGHVALPWPSFPQASRTTGTLALAARDGVHLTVAAAPGLARIDPAEVTPAGTAPGAVDVAFRFQAPPADLAVEVALLAPELRVQTATLVRLGSDDTTVNARFHVEVRQAGTFALTVEVPATWDLSDTSDLAIDEVRPQEIPAGAALRRFTLQLRSQLIGEKDFTCRFHAPPVLGAAAGFALAAPRLVGARTARGVLAVAAPRSLALVAADRLGLAGLDPAEAARQPLLAELLRDQRRDEDLALAFAWQGVAAEAPRTRLSASPRPRETSATIEDRITVKDGQIARLATIRGEVRYNPATALTLVLPAAWDDLVVFRATGLGERVRSAGPTPGTSTWELRFQPALLGAFQLQVEATAPSPRLAPGKPAELSVPAIGLPGVGTLTYLAAVARDGAIDLVAQAPGLDPVAPADLPAGLSGGAVAGFQGAQPAVLGITATRQDLLALAEAGVGEAAWLAVLGEDGVARLRGRLLVLSRGRTQLALALPAGSTLVEAAVDGRAARPSRRDDGAVILGLPADGGSHKIAVVIEHAVADLPSVRGTLRLPLPRIAGAAGTPTIPVARTTVSCWMPRAWVVSGTAGDLARGDDDRSDTLDGLLRDGDSDGLSVPVTPAGQSLRFARIGDGGTVEIGVLHQRLHLALTVAAGLAGLALGWLLRRRPVAAGAVLAVLGAGMLLALEGWLPIAVAAGAGVAGGLVLGAAAVLIHAWRARRAARRSVEPDPWIEQAGTPS